MYKRYYSGYDDSDFEENVIFTEKENDCSGVAQNSEIAVTSLLREPSISGFGDKVIGPLAIDDIILIGVFLLLLEENCDDKLMLIVIGFVLVMGFVV